MLLETQNNLETSTAKTDSHMFSLVGQTAIVTGAAAGIGEAIAVRLARAGATVAVVDVNLRGGQCVADSLPNGSFAIHGDAADSASVQRAIEEVSHRQIAGRMDHQDSSGCRECSNGYKLGAFTRGHLLPLCSELQRMPGTQKSILGVSVETFISFS